MRLSCPAGCAHEAVSAAAHMHCLLLNVNTSHKGGYGLCICLVMVADTWTEGSLCWTALTNMELSFYPKIYLYSI